MHKLRLNRTIDIFIRTLVALFTIKNDVIDVYTLTWRELEGRGKFVASTANSLSCERESLSGWTKPSDSRSRPVSRNNSEFLFTLQ